MQEAESEYILSLIAALCVGRPRDLDCSANVDAYGSRSCSFGTMILR